ncbi:MAG: indolepyruvate ferredoxin oxidoreductase subunit alpha [Treponema sp.]|jgi:indolepyruvate ferredoxin oxidoreductase alpha subunit|nr:indolepyruvate ferredoxin oxidoreductase subunit alpha [Treponema sp.]
MTENTVLGDEAVAIGAIHAGLSAAYGYPGTPSTEIMEYLIDAARVSGDKDAFTARWCVNEKTAMEAALGVSFAGRRALVTMKHVGLNVASDPFINGALLGIKGGLVIAVADDPGMHSSQNEQDSRFYAAFALVPCFEPRNQQEAYCLTREAFDLSEKYGVPVLLRLATRLSHARASVTLSPPREQNPCKKTTEKAKWMLLPAHARNNYADLVETQKKLRAWSETHAVNKLELDGRDRSFAVITGGLGGNYFEENEADIISARGILPARLHIGAYPLPLEQIRTLCAQAAEVTVIEEGQPFIEERLRGLLAPRVKIKGRLEEGALLPRTGELDSDAIRSALGLPAREALVVKNELARLPARPPQLCAGCPHADSYETLNRVVAELDGSPGHPGVSVNSDIGCYSLGAVPPFNAVESIVCMGASIGMARGAADAGIPYAFAVIGDSTFIHSGITALIDAVQAHTPLTIIILDNSIVAMTGCQPTALPSAGLRSLVLGSGLDPAHYLELDAYKKNVEENAARLKKEAEYRGPSVAVFRRECLEAARKRLKAKR